MSSQDFLDSFSEASLLPAANFWRAVLAGIARLELMPAIPATPATPAVRGVHS